MGVVHEINHSEIHASMELDIELIVTPIVTKKKESSKKEGGEVTWREKEDFDWDCRISKEEEKK